jgi:hypothetical protein
MPHNKAGGWALWFLNRIFARMKSGRIALAAGMLCSLLQSASAQVGGNATYQFLNLPFSARTASLGGNLICVKDDDINLIVQNPSLLNSSMSNKLALNYINYFSDINYGYTTYARTIGKLGNFSAGMQYLDYGKFTRADETGETDGSVFFASEYCLNLGYSHEIDTMFSLGAQLKTIYSNLESYWSIGNAVDLGATYNNTKRNLTAAIVVKNIGMEWRTYMETRERLPFEVQAGFSAKPKHAPFRLSVIGTHLEQWDLTYIDPANPPLTEDPLTHEPIKQSKTKIFGDKLMRHVVVGGELLLTKNFNIRLGYNYERRKELKVDTRPGLIGFSFGFGFKISKFQLSYGHAAYHLAGGTNHFTITTNLSDFYKKKS